MRDVKDLQQFWRRYADAPKMLCTIVGKQGSGYRGTGAKKMILQNGEACGYLSGGCLEGEIIRTAQEQWREAPFIQSFSTMSEEDRLMGYQTGCAGVIEILFEHLPDNIEDMSLYLPFGKTPEFEAVAVSLEMATLGQRTPVKDEQNPKDCFIDSWVKPLHLYVLGCGANARPFADLAPPLGWDATFLDYRQSNELPPQDDVESRVIPLNEFAANIEPGVRTAVVVATHNYEADLDIMMQLNGMELGYIGAIGPRRRFEQICRDANKLHGVEINAGWAEHVHAPAGIHKARSPEDIAFSIIAEIQFKEDI